MSTNRLYSTDPDLISLTFSFTKMQLSCKEYHNKYRVFYNCNYRHSLFQTNLSNSRVALSTYLVNSYIKILNITFKNDVHIKLIFIIKKIYNLMKVTNNNANVQEVFKINWNSDLKSKSLFRIKSSDSRTEPANF